MSRIEIEKITIRGFKSIRVLNDFRPRKINVFIGQNGAGKSNFIGFFKFLSNMLGGTGNLSAYTALNGGASTFLFDGAEETPQLSASMALRSETGLNEYKFRLAHAASDTFIYTEEQFRYTNNAASTVPEWYNLGAGHKESALIHAEATGRTQGTIRRLLQQLVTYQFHNTTFNSPIRNNKAEIENGWYLEEDGRNLAAVLFELRERQTEIYQKIVAIVQQIIPFFDDFVLENQYGRTYLKWRERNSTVTFVATQASDGMLRAMALVTLLCLPPDRLPAVMLLDEPELGLHPSSVKTICDLVQGVAEHCQVFIATQDADMLDQFEIEDTIVVDRNGRESEFRQLSQTELAAWIDEYSLSDMWHQNIIGGRP
jgi:predicted ATPase